VQPDLIEHGRGLMLRNDVSRVLQPPPRRTCRATRRATLTTRAFRLPWHCRAGMQHCAAKARSRHCDLRDRATPL
jgi:hypothetical protein